MAIRKVSQLTPCVGTGYGPPSPLNKISLTPTDSPLGNSYFEISYNGKPTGSNTAQSMGVYTSQKITYKQLFNDITNNLYKGDSWLEGSKYFGKFPNEINWDDNNWFETQVSSCGNIGIKSGWYTIYNDNYRLSCGKSMSMRSPSMFLDTLSGKWYGEDMCMQSEGLNDGDGISFRSQNGIYFEIPNSDENPKPDDYPEYGWHPVTKVDMDGKWYFSKEIAGVAMSAWWADLAEVYNADENYKPGTLVKFGGDAEITVADKNVNAVISTNPAFLMNSGELKYKNKVPVALIGRVPVRIKGKINKFDRIILSDVPGVGIRKPWYSLKKSIGVALESNDETDEKLVLCSIKLKI